MSASGEKKSRGGRGKANVGIYVYCVGQRDDLRQLFDDELPCAVEEARLELIADDDLAAVVSEVPLADFGEQPLQERLADAAWVAVRAMRHEKVIEHFAARLSVIPLRFGTIYLRRDRILRMISERHEELRAIIERLRGCEEWGVNICRDLETLMKAVVSISPRLVEINRRAAEAGPGQSYLLRKQIDALSADEARRETQRVVSEIKSELAAISDGAKNLTVMKGEMSEAGEVAAKLAFLVSRSRFKDFRALAERLAQRSAAAGFRLEMTGPWPAYNFSAVSDEHD